MLRSRAVAAFLGIVLTGCGAAPALPARSVVPSVTSGAASTLTPAPTLTSSPDAHPPGSPAFPGLPLGFPVPPDAVPLPLAAGRAVVGRWRVAPGSATYHFYQQALRGAGYSITDLAAGDTVASIRFADASGVTWQIDIAGDTESAVLEVGPVHP